MLKDWNKARKWQTQNANALIKAFKASSVEPCVEEIYINRSIEVLCTYEWKRTSLEKDSGEKPAIYVPGFGNRFSAPSLPHRMKEDTGTAWQDQHLYRVFQQQFEPLFQAMSVMNPGVRFNDVNVVIDFTEATGKADTDGYHRAIWYALGPITLVVRLEVDAFLDDEKREATDDLFHGYKTVSGPNHRAGIRHENATSVVLGGCYVSHAAVAELKVNRGSDEQLWAGHYRNNIVADRTTGGFGPTEDLTRKERKERGELIAKNKAEGKKGGYMTIHSAKPKDVRKECLEWDRHNGGSLQKLAGLFSGLIDAMKQVEGDKAMLREESRGGELKLYQGGEDMVDALPEEIVNIFWD
ncbi:hypothetical protein GRF29_161g567714 [Pseudopithomyces chartarum]|uniref:Uncharacterized protein n=1 Tax=Pseudopithomyces chartarum TaxID=1892770 RepID=A0AAN6LPU7_9PLEO|nr:hypothetical protein GRF29_161g567714 [Pseudopithomyces chartarum]